MSIYTGPGTIQLDAAARLHCDPTAELYVQTALSLGICPRFCWPERPMSLFCLEKDATARIGSAYICYGADIAVMPAARLVIGDHVWVNNRLRMRCAQSIEIGSNTTIGPDVSIADTDGHDISPSPRPSQASIVIGKRVWICARALLLKGISVGDGAVIAAGAIVTHDVPPATLVAGNPAKVIRRGVKWT